MEQTYIKQSQMYELKKINIKRILMCIQNTDIMILYFVY